MKLLKAQKFLLSRVTSDVRLCATLSVGLHLYNYVNMGLYACILTKLDRSI